MTNLEIVRMNLDDHIQVGFASEMSIGNLAVYQMNNHNIWQVVVKDSDGTIIDAENYTVYPQSGQIRGEFPEGEINVEYLFAGFTDDELQHYLDTNGDSVAKATLDCINVLLASAAKRFDYKAGLKDIKASQVFKNLKDLRDTFVDKVNTEDNSGSSAVPLFINRTHPAYEASPRVREDISRRD